MQERQRIIDAHHNLILELRDIENKIEEMLASENSQWRELEDKRRHMQHRVEPLIEQYWKWIHPVLISRCPYCNQDLYRKFDAYDLNGFWWMDRTQRATQEPPACEHFCLVQGAVNTKDLPISGGLFECYPGTDKPFVIPRILQMPSMVAVITKIQMHCGYEAYPIAYFSKQVPEPKELTQAWGHKEHLIPLSNGREGWAILSEQYDYDLIPWLKEQKVYVFAEGHLKAYPELSENDIIFHVKGRAQKQRILNQSLSYIL